MSANTYEAAKTVENQKKGTLRGHLAQLSPFPVIAEKREKTTRAAKSSVDYWKPRVRPRTLKDGAQTPELYLRLKQAGRDAWICLDTANRASAAAKARDYWQSVQVKGLDAVLAERRPAARPARVCTVGEYIAAARTVSTTRPRTFGQYEAALRRVAAGIAKIEGNVGRFAAGSQANTAWRAEIDAIRLDKLTPSAVKAWQKNANRYRLGRRRQGCSCTQRGESRPQRPRPVQRGFAGRASQKPDAAGRVAI